MGEECSMHLRNDNWVQGLGLDGGDNIKMTLKRVNWNHFVQHWDQ